MAIKVWYCSLVILMVAIAVPVLAQDEPDAGEDGGKPSVSKPTAKPTLCSYSFGQFVCEKRDYKEDKIIIKNRSDRHVSFKITERESPCVGLGHVYATREDSLEPGESKTYQFKSTFKSSPSLTSIGELIKILTGKCGQFIVNSCSPSLSCNRDLDIWAE